MRSVRGKIVSVIWTNWFLIFFGGLLWGHRLARAFPRSIVDHRKRRPVAWQKTISRDYLPGNPVQSKSLYDDFYSCRRMNVETRRFASESPVDEVDTNFRSGVFVLLSVPLAWGTFEPAVRYVYDVAPQIPTLLFSVAYYAVAVMGLFVVLMLEQNHRNNQHTLEDMMGSSLRGGIELGTFLFLGNALQVFGLRTVPSDRAAFLLQLTTIFVPFLQAVLSGSLTSISNRVWFASFAALAGVAILSLDGADSESVSFMTGDPLIIGAALLYTFHCVRLEVYAKTTSAVQLALTKAVTELSLSIIAVVTLVLGSDFLGEDSPSSVATSCASSGEAIKTFLSNFSQTLRTGNYQGLLAAGAATTWIGLVTVAYTICAQSYGQKYVEAAKANLIYTTQPLYTALFAWILLGETLGPQGYFGGIVLLLAVLLVTLDGSNPEKER